MEYARRYLNTDGSEINWVMIRTLMASVADTVLFPLQDVVGVGSEGRMNLPGTSSGNWRWRFRGEQLTPAASARLKQMVETYERYPTISSNFSGSGGTGWDGGSITFST